MSELRVPRSQDPSGPTQSVRSNGRNGRQPPGQQERRPRRGPAGAEELAVALSETRRGALGAQFTQDADGNPLILIVDRERSETVAVFTPEELRALAEQTGLPTGLLVQAAS